MSDIFNMADTWNNGATVFTSIKMNVTNTASDSASLLMDLQIASASKFKVGLDGAITIAGGAIMRPIVAASTTANHFGILVHHVSVSQIFEGKNGGFAFGAGAPGDTFEGLWAPQASPIGWYDFANNTPDLRLTRVGAAIMGLRGASSSAGAVLSFVEQTAPSAPSANGCYVYAEDNGGGKTRLMAKFNTGAAQQMAIEP